MINSFAFAVVGAADEAASGYLLSFYPTTLYSMRKRNSAYSGPCIKVRNSTTSVETDIGFSSDGWIDAAALNAASAGSQSLFVTTWYDQSGSAVHATNTDTTTQPRIVNAGVTDAMQGKPAIYFHPGGASRFLSVATNAAFGFGTGAFTIEIYARTTTPSFVAGYNSALINFRSSGGTGANPAELYISDTGYLNWYYGAGNNAGPTLIAGSTDYAFTASYVGGAASTFRAFRNGVVEFAPSVTQDFTSSRNMIIGWDASDSFKGLIGEIAITKGTCVFTAAHTPRSYSYDHWTQVKFYLDVNITGTLTDAKGHTCAANANAVVSTALGFPTMLVTAGGRLDVTMGADAQLGGGDFRIRCKVRPTALGIGIIVETYSGSPAGSGFYLQLNDSSGRVEGGLYSGSGTAGVCNSGSFMLATGTTYDIEYGRSGTSFQLSIDGVSRGTATSAGAANAGPTRMELGGDLADGGSLYSFQGHIWGLSVEPGVAGHLGSFTPDPLYLP